MQSPLREEVSLYKKIIFSSITTSMASNKEANAGIKEIFSYFYNCSYWLFFLIYFTIMKKTTTIQDIAARYTMLTGSYTEL